MTLIGRGSDVLAIIAMASLLCTFIAYVLGVTMHYGKSRHMINDIGGHVSPFGFTIFPVMLFECIAARRLFKRSGQKVPVVVQAAFYFHLATVISFLLFVLAGFGSVLIEGGMGIPIKI